MDRISAHFQHLLHDLYRSPCCCEQASPGEPVEEQLSLAIQALKFDRFSLLILSIGIIQGLRPEHRVSS